MIDFNFITRFRAKDDFRKGYQHAKLSYLNRIRRTVTLFYFAMGLTFASWASRIPDIKATLGLSDGELGTILFSIPMGQLLVMPFSGKLVTRFSSYRMLIISLLLYAFALASLGFASVRWQLALGLFFFGMAGNVCNIAVNTQGVYTEMLFRRTIMGSFHGMWSFAGFTGALVGLGMMAIKLTPLQHFCIILAMVVLVVAFGYKFLIKTQEVISTKKKKIFSKPDAALLWLGVIGFCCMASEGVMFDWSGVYFKDIVKAPGPLVVLGYTSFMIMMAGGRFLGDKVIHRFGRKKVLQISGLVISSGLFLSVLLPYIIPCTIAFMMVGLGVSTIVPTVYSIAGKNKTVPPGEALTIVSSVSFFGFLMGPPVIGYIAEAFSLRLSFALIGIFGIFIAIMVSKLNAFRTM
ncbi:MAG: MFS transporter [Flavobacterium sp. BFFFF1]|uniref:MFS transporter n=1 Tax=Flavobacterium sp. BFFFF1 TaxID=2015557 RepID=UPI000BC8B7A8|nr:MFS transporter [Flavobacterium sp. BFFFF1]OYU80895.1 MAG: MFS transporter [Flavobacterium sp. BFFFF1]